MTDLKREQEVVDVLKKKFGEKILEIKIQNERRIFVKVADPIHLELLKFSIEKWGAWHLIALAGVDTPEGVFAAVYHFDIIPPHGAETAVSITIRIDCPDRKNPKISSITKIIPGALFYERETHDLMGIVFQGHPNLDRLIIPENFSKKIFPLRKDFLLEIQKKEEAEKAAKAAKV